MLFRSLLEHLDVSDNVLTHIDLRLFDPAIAPKLRAFNGQRNVLQPPVNQCWAMGDEGGCATSSVVRASRASKALAAEARCCPGAETPAVDDTEALSLSRVSREDRRGIARS
jgi:hypothetical protein